MSEGMKLEVGSNCGKIALIVLTLFFVACRNEGEQLFHADYEWDCSVTNTGNYIINADFPSASLLELEQTEESIIGRISKVVRSDSLLFVLDSDLAKSIFLFSYPSGKFITSFGTVGSGPGEYLTPNDISFDALNNLLYVLSDRRKIYAYNMSGDLVIEHNAPYLSERMEYNEDRFYFYCVDDEAGEIVVTDQNMQVVSSYFPNVSSNIKHQLLHPFHINSNGELTYIRYLDNKIYRVSDEDITVKYILNFGKNGYLRDEAESDSDEERKSKMKARSGRLKYFVENDSNAVLLFFVNNEPILSIFDKREGKSKNYPVKDITEENWGFLVSPLEFTVNNGFVQVVDPSMINSQEQKLGKTPKSADYVNPYLYILR